MIHMGIYGWGKGLWIPAYQTNGINSHDSDIWKVTAILTRDDDTDQELVYTGKKRNLTI